MIGVILAAGMAKRLRPLTDICPKCLLEVGGRTLLERIADAMLNDAGCSELVVVTGYRANMIREYLTEHYPNVKITFLDNADYENNNNIYSLWMASKLLKGKDVLLMDSDILCDPKAVKRIGQQQESALAMQRHELGEEEIKVIIDEKNPVYRSTDNWDAIIKSDYNSLICATNNYIITEVSEINNDVFRCNSEVRRIVLPETITETFILPTPVKEGYIFGGWYWETDFSGDPVTQLEVGANGTMYAKWNSQSGITTSLPLLDYNYCSITIKLLLNGKIVILREGKMYDMLGRIVL